MRKRLTTEALNSIETKSNIIARSPLIWQEGQYKVNVNFKKYETHHNKDRVHLEVSKGDEKGVIAIEDGEVLNGNLKPSSVNWCKKNVLTEENKKRILKMIQDDKFYRLDRKFEKESHSI